MLQKTLRFKASNGQKPAIIKIVSRKTRTTTTHPVWRLLGSRQQGATFDKNRSGAAAGAKRQGAGVPTIIFIKKHYPSARPQTGFLFI